MTSASTEVGVKFKADTFGVVTGIRFYKASTNTGTHIGNLWTSSGQLLASATFTGESGSGWQQVNFAQPVALNKNTTYIASYFAPRGHYSDDSGYFYTTPELGPAPTITNVDSPPLHALRNTNGVVNGVFAQLGQQHLPDQLRRRHELLGGPGLHTADLHHAARPGRQRQCDRRLRLGHCLTGRPRRQATR